jgi:hypothetical protein
VAASEDIPANKAIVCIPSRLMITKELICKGELKSLIESHPDLFSEKLYASNEFNYFVIWLIREKVKGK